MQHQPHHLYRHTRPRAPSSHHRLALKRRQHDAHVVVTVVVQDPSIHPSIYPNRENREREREREERKRNVHKRSGHNESTNDRRVVRRPIASTRPNARAIRIRSAARNGSCSQAIGNWNAPRFEASNNRVADWESTPRVEGEERGNTAGGGGMGREKGPGEFAPPGDGFCALLPQ